LAEETISPADDDPAKRPAPTQPPNNAADKAAREPHMRIASFIFAFALLFLGPSMAGPSATGSVPHVGTFAFTGSPVVMADAPVLMASLR
jgi:hypothetical protein